jgi:hypothetical protein
MSHHMPWSMSVPKSARAMDNPMAGEGNQPLVGIVCGIRTTLLIEPAYWPLGLQAMACELDSILYKSGTVGHHDAADSTEVD